MSNSASAAKRMDLAGYIRGRGRPVFMPYLTVGDPSFDATVSFAVRMIDAGADLIELGIPFSDPTADGPVIQAAMQRALDQPDFSLSRVFETARRIHEERPQVPIVVLTYLNPVLRGFPAAPATGPKGWDSFDARTNLARFLGECRTAGVVGLVIPDLPFDQPEGELLQELAPEYGVHPILLIAPNTSKRRFREICGRASGFIYYVTSLGVTGSRSTLPTELAANVAKVQSESGVPVLAGFGISTPDQAAPLRSIVDGVIVGSLNHSLIAEHGTQAGLPLAEATAGFVQALQVPAS